MNYYKIILITLFCFLLNKNAFSQPQTEWVQRYNSSGNHNDYVTDMAIDKSGNVYLTGYVQVNDTDQNFVTIKYNTQGDEQWVRYYDGPDHREDKPVAIAVDDSGNVIVSGSSYSSNSSFDFLTIKYSSSGDSIWVRRYTDGLIASSMVIDEQRNVYVTGIKFGLNSEDIATVKYNYLGNLIWIRNFNGPTDQYDESYDMIINKFNILYVSGGSLGTGGIILRYDLDGNELPFIFGTDYFGYKILLDSSLNIFLGYDAYNTSTRNDIAVAKLDSLGNLNWIRKYHHSSLNNNDNFRAICLDKSNNVIVTGVSAKINEQGWDIATIKYFSNGDTAWINRYDPVFNSNDDSKSIITDKYSNVYVAGGSDGGLFSKYVLIKYNANGNQEWVTFYNNNNPFTSHSAFKVLVDTSGSIFLTGFSYGNGSGLDIATIKYSKATLISNYITNISTEYKLFQNYPNPFNSQTTISYFLKFKSKVLIKIFNNLGKQVSTLIDKNQNDGYHTINFDANSYPSGLYYYSMFLNGEIFATNKLLVVK